MRSFLKGNHWQTDYIFLFMQRNYIPTVKPVCQVFGSLALGDFQRRDLEWRALLLTCHPCSVTHFTNKSSLSLLIPAGPAQHGQLVLVIPEDGWIGLGAAPRNQWREARAPVEGKTLPLRHASRGAVSP